MGRLPGADGQARPRIRAVLDTEKRAKEADDAFDALSGRKPDRATAPRRGGRCSRRSASGRAARTAHPRRWTSGTRPPGRSTTGPDRPVRRHRVRLIPTDFYDQLIAHLIEVSGIMQCGPTVLNTGGGETLQIPKTTAHSFTGHLQPGLRRATCPPPTRPSPWSP